MRGRLGVLLIYLLSGLCSAFSMGYAAHRDGLLSPYVLGNGLVLLCMVSWIVVTLWDFIAAARWEQP